MVDSTIFDEILQIIRKEFEKETGNIPLHEPLFIGNERDYVLDAIDTTYVASVGRYVDQLEKIIASQTGARYAVAVVNGTSALHTALLLAGVERGDEVITQPLTFVATGNAITYAGGKPLFVDVDKDTLGLSPEKLNHFLEQTVTFRNGSWINKHTGKRIAACVPVHTFGIPARINDIIGICKKYDIPVVEDAAESQGSTFNGKHTGTFGMLGVFSFNGNKTITCGGGGAIITDNEALAQRAKHITTTAKKNHQWEYIHTEIGFNYRMPNLNAALACAQMEMLDIFIKDKRALAQNYAAFFKDKDITFISEPQGCRSNYWLNAIQLTDRQERDDFLTYSNERDIMTRPVWRLLNKLPMFEKCMTGNLDNAVWLESRIVNIPSSVRL